MFDSNQFNFGFRRKMRLLLQSEGAECGVACIAMIADYYGYRTNLAELRQRFSISLKGTHFAGLTQIAHELGLSTRPVKADLPNLAQLKLPCILHWNFNHFVVLTSVGKRSVTVFDPSAGVRRVAMTEVSSLFTGVALEIWPGQSFRRKAAPVQLRLRDLLGTISGWRRWLGKLMLLGLALEVFGLASPLLLQWVVDDVIVSGDTDLLTTLIIGFSGILLIHQAVVSIRAWGIIYFSTSLGMQWRTNVLTHLLNLPVQYFEKRHLGDIMSRFGSVDQIQKTLSTSFLETVLDGLMTIATLAMMFAYSPLMSSIALLAVAIYAIARWSLYGQHKEALEETIIQSARQESQLLETFRGIKTIKLFQRQHERKSTWLSAYVDKLNADLRVQRLDVLFKLINGIVGGAANIAVISVGAHLVLKHEISAGILLAFLAYKTQFDSRIISLVAKLLELRMLRLQVERVADIVMTEPEAQFASAPSGSDVDDCPSIELENVRFRYSDQDPFVLDGISLRVTPGESVVITGPSGCGKSTLLNILLGILPPTQGEIRVAGTPLKGDAVQGARSIIGSVLQDDVLFAGSIAANISFFDPQIDIDWVKQCAQYAAIDDDIKMMPMGYETLVGDMGTVLSGGQKQRVLLARALYRRPRILILDEATSHLDSRSEALVNTSIKNLQITRLFVAHRAETIASADRQIVISHGKIVEDTLQRPHLEHITPFQRHEISA